MTFWNTIVQTNTFNFAVLLLIFAVLYKKLNISETVEKIKQDIIENIENAKTEREKAKQKLFDAQKAFSHVEDEIKDRMKEASKRAQGLSEQIEKETLSKIAIIEKNIHNSIEAEEKTLSSKMTEKALKKSVKLAKEQIINTLKNNPKLHDKYIEESIGEI